MTYDDLTVPQPFLEGYINITRAAYINAYFNQYGTYPTEAEIKNIAISTETFENLKRRYYALRIAENVTESTPIKNDKLVEAIKQYGPIPYDEFWYTTINEETVHPYVGASDYTSNSVYDLEIISNVYENGIGKVKFSSPLTYMPKGFFQNTNRITSFCIPECLLGVDINVLCNEQYLTSVIFTNFAQFCQISYNGRGFLNNDNSGTTNCYFKDSLIKDTLVIPNEVEFIDRSFQNYSLIENVYMGDNVKRLNCAFHRCSNLKNIRLSNSLTVLGTASFSFCDKLENVYLPTTLTQIGDQCFWSCATLTAMNLPDNLQSIGSTAFSSCIKLISINIPQTVEYIGRSCFRGCSSLTEIEIPSSVTSLNENVFLDCISLKKVILNNGITTIGSFCFYGCSSLEEIVIPKSITKINVYAFYGTNLKNIYMEPLSPPVLIDWYGDTDHKAPMAFDKINEDAKIYVYEDAYEAYINDEKWKKYKNKIVVR